MSGDEFQPVPGFEACRKPGRDEVSRFWQGNSGETQRGSIATGDGLAAPKYEPERAISLIEEALERYSERTQRESEGGQPHHSSILFCLRAAVTELKGVTPLGDEESRREAISWLLLALNEDNA